MTISDHEHGRRRLRNTILLVAALYLVLWACTYLIGQRQVRRMSEWWGFVSEQNRQTQDNVVTTSRLRTWSPCPFLLIVDKINVRTAFDLQVGSSQQMSNTREYHLWLGIPLGASANWLPGTATARVLGLNSDSLNAHYARDRWTKDLLVPVSALGRPLKEDDTCDLQLEVPHPRTLHFVLDNVHYPMSMIGQALVARTKQVGKPLRVILWMDKRCWADDTSQIMAAIQEAQPQTVCFVVQNEPDATGRATFHVVPPSEATNIWTNNSWDSPPRRAISSGEAPSVHTGAVPAAAAAVAAPAGSY